MLMKKHTKKIILSAGVLALTVGVTWLFTLTLVSRDSQQAATRTSRDSRETLCTATTPQYCGRILVRKVAVPQVDQDFTFTHSIPGYASPIMLDDDGTLGNPLNNTFTFMTPFNGVFSVAETTDPNYETSITCTDPSGGTTSSGSSVSINILNGETVQCVFTNTRVIGQVPVTPSGTTTPGTGTSAPPMPQTGNSLAKYCTPNTWTQKASFGGGPRAYAASFSVGTKGYVGTGYDSTTTNVTQDFWEFDTVANTWTQKANFPGTARARAIGFSIGTKGYIGTGDDSSGLFEQDFWEFDTLANTWTQKANFGGGQRADAVGFSIGNKGYVGSGYIVGPPFLSADFWEFDPSMTVMGTWTQKTSLSAGMGGVGFSVGGAMGYIAPGSDTSINQSFWEFDPSIGAGGTWSPKASFPAGGRWRSVGFSIGTKGYFGAGAHNNISQHDFWQFDPSVGTTGAWTQKQQIPGYGRSGAFSFSAGNKGYVGGGSAYDTHTDVVYQDFWEYCP